MQDVCGLSDFKEKHHPDQWYVALAVPFIVNIEQVSPILGSVPSRWSPAAHFHDDRDSADWH